MTPFHMKKEPLHYKVLKEESEDEKRTEEEVQMVLTSNDIIWDDFQD